MQFPHLSDTAFPNLGNVDVYKFQNNFDYTRWSSKTKLKLCNVLWNSSYTDIVKFTNDKRRDEYFDSLEDTWTLELATDARIVPDGSIKLPVPYDVLARYNYLFVDIPIATSPDNMIDYENLQGIRRWYFFVDNILYLSPNATQVFLLPDIWTNFQNDVDITYMLLERGHAPVAASSTDFYLQNPIANNTYLLAPDVNFDNAGITRSSDFIPVGNSDKWVCFASTCAVDQIGELGSVNASQDFNPNNPITYEDVDVRFGRQLRVNGFAVGNGMNYGVARTPAKTGVTDGVIGNNLTVYAIPAVDCYNGNFLADVQQFCPQFLQTLRACFVVDSACLNFYSATYNIAGHTVRRCRGKQTHMLTKHLQKSDFGYPQYMERFAKLYTSPYSCLEITDNDGHAYEVKIEETSTLSAELVVSVAFPYINERVYFEGIGGVGSVSYSWVDLNGNLDQLQMPNCDWFKYCFDWQIPTFSLFMDGQTAFMLGSFNRNVRQAINQSLVDYHCTMRSANTACENAKDQANVAYNNTVENADTAKVNAYNSATCGLINASNNADMQAQNAYNSAGCNAQNTFNSAGVEAQNANNSTGCDYRNSLNVNVTSNETIDESCTLQSANLILSNNAIENIEEAACIAGNSITAANNGTNAHAATVANWVATSNSDVEVQKTVSTTQTSAIATIASGAFQGGQTGFLLGGTAGMAVGTVTLPVLGTVSGSMAGALGGMVLGAIGGGISATAATTNAVAIADGVYSSVQNQITANISLMQNANSKAVDIQGYMNDQKRLNYRTNRTTGNNQLYNSNVVSRAIGDANKALGDTNAQNVKLAREQNTTNLKETNDQNTRNSENTAKMNADNAQETAIRNANNTNATSEANADNDYYTSELCGRRTRNNVIDNAEYTREVSELNAKEILENGRYGAQAAIDDSRNATPVECCAASGNPAPDYYMTRGVQIKVKTQSDSALRQTCDIFARYGYALNQVWDVEESGLNLMEHFTYWKAEEIWVDDRKTSNNAVNNFIHDMFLRGVTVWKNPDEIGKVWIYDN